MAGVARSESAFARQRKRILKNVQCCGVAQSSTDLPSSGSCIPVWVSDISLNEHCALCIQTCRFNTSHISHFRKGNVDNMKNLLFIGIALLACMTMPEVRSAEPGWSPVVIATGDYREQLEKTPIVNRPYRPFHFYGNTVRRRHYRGMAVPMPRDLVTFGLFPVMMRNQ